METVRDIRVRNLGLPMTHEKNKPLETSVLYSEIPDGGYGWLIVFACFLLNFTAWGANSGFAIYLSYYLNNDTFAGADKYDYALIGGLTFGVGLVFAPAINYIQGRIGMRPTIILGNCFQFAALMMASFAKRLWQLYLTQGLLQSFGLAFIYLPTMTILPQWFKYKRSLASSIAAAGSGCGGLVFNLGMQKVLEAKSVFWALRVQSILCFCLTWISIFLLRSRIESKNSLYDSEIMRSVGFWVFCLYYIFCMLGYVIVLYGMANFTTSLGYTPYQGSIASAMVQVGNLVGRPIVGQLSDKFGVMNITICAYVLCGVFSIAMWIPARNFATVIVLCLILGSMMGSVFGSTPPILARLVGLRNVGVGVCMSWPFLGLAGLASPVIGIALKSGNHGFVDPDQYVNSSVFAGVAFFCCSASLLILRGYLIARADLDDTDADHGHLHLIVPVLEPFRRCFRPIKF